MGNDDDLGYDEPDHGGNYDKCMTCRKLFNMATAEDEEGVLCDACFDAEVQAEIKRSEANERHYMSQIAYVCGERD